MWTVDDNGNTIRSLDLEQMNRTTEEKYPKPMAAFTTDSPYLEAEAIVKRCCKKLYLIAETGYGFVLCGEANNQTWKRTLTTLKKNLQNVKIIKENY